MKTSRFYSAADIDKAVDAIIRIRPAYQEILQFYRKIFMAQEEIAQQLHLEPKQISEDVISVKMGAGFPLIDMSEFTLDQEASERLLANLFQIASDANEALRGAAQKLSTAMQNGLLKVSILYHSLLDTKGGDFQSMADAIEIEKEVLHFFIYNSAKPSLLVCAKELSKQIPSLVAWREKICPICGNAAGIASIEGQGERFLFCSFCWMKWRVQRLICAFCDNEDPKSCQYFYSNEEAEYRVETCNHCKKYLKTVDIRQIDRTFYPPLEQVSTLHLDIKAAELGFQNPMPSHHL
jgi:FdhE protein